MTPLAPVGTYFQAMMEEPESLRPTRKRPIQSSVECFAGACHRTVMVLWGMVEMGEASMEYVPEEVLICA
jgi:hypothetical protein